MRGFSSSSPESSETVMAIKYFFKGHAVYKDKHPMGQMSTYEMSLAPKIKEQKSKMSHNLAILHFVLIDGILVSVYKEKYCGPQKSAPILNKNQIFCTNTLMAKITCGIPFGLQNFGL